MSTHIDSEAFLIAETERFRKKTKLTWSLGGLLALLVLGYFSWITYQFNTLVLSSDNLSHAVAIELNNSVPGLLKDLETDLTQSAPANTKRVADELRGMIPYIEVAGKQQIDVLYGLVPYLEQESEGLISYYFNQNAEIIRDFYNANNQKGFIDHFVNEMVDGLIHEIDKDFTLTYAGQPIQGMKKVSLVNLYHMNQSLRDLASMHPHEMNRSERLQRRLIVAWFNALAYDKL